MFLMRGYVLLAAAALVLAAMPSAATASTVSYGFQGMIAPANDDLLALFQFTIDADSPNVFLATLSNGGGVFYPAAAPYGGTTVDEGGFETELTLWTSAGDLLATSATCGNLGGDACIGTDPAGDFGKDPGFTYTTLEPLKAGTYILALTEYGNQPLGTLSQGWSFDDPGQIPSGGPFVWGGNGDYSVEILNVNGATQLPEPNGFCLFGSGLALIALGFFRRKRAAPGAVTAD